MTDHPQITVKVGLRVGAIEKTCEVAIDIPTWSDWDMGKLATEAFKAAWKDMEVETSDGAEVRNACSPSAARS